VRNIFPLVRITHTLYASYPQGLLAFFLEIVMKKILFVLMTICFCNQLLADNLLGLPALDVPDDNPQTAEKIELGQVLFNDKRLSADGTINCASCHHPEKAFTDGLPVAQGIKKQKGTRNAPTIVNSAFYNSFFHDGRASSLEEQALGPFLNPIEHGLEDESKIIDLVKHDANYVEKFKQVYGVSQDDISISDVAKAIASYERTIVNGNSLFDQYFYARNRSVLLESAARGSRIFKRKGNCSNCHEMNWKSALFTDQNFYNIGVGFDRVEPVVDKVLSELRKGAHPDDLNLTDAQRSELGRFSVTRVIADIGKFKTPGLRNIALTAPYMHDGSLETLEDVIEYYDKGGDDNRFKDSAIFPLHLTGQEKKDLVAFLGSLTSSVYLKVGIPNSGFSAIELGK
jgi:cytochrome c peroxidase